MVMDLNNTIRPEQLVEAHNLTAIPFAWITLAVVIIIFLILSLLFFKGRDSRKKLIILAVLTLISSSAITLALSNMPFVIQKIKSVFMGWFL